MVIWLGKILCYNKRAVNKKKPFVLPERNPDTQQAHHHEVFWQIIIPILVGLLIVLGLAVTVNFGTTGSVNRWGEISLASLILLWFFFGMILFGILATLIYATTYLLWVIPPYARLVQDVFVQVKGKVKSGADAAVEPFIRLHAVRAGWQALLRRD